MRKDLWPYAEREGGARRQGHAQRPGTAQNLDPARQGPGREHVDLRCADETCDGKARRRVVDRLGRVDLQELSAEHHGDAVRHRHRLDLVVSDVDEGGAEPAMQFGDLGPRLNPQLRVEVRERLVHEEGGGLAHHGAGERHALALTARQLARLAAHEVAEIKAPRDGADFAGERLLRSPGTGEKATEERQPLPSRHPAHRERQQADILGHRHVGVERVGLEHHRHVRALGGRSSTGRPSISTEPESAWSRPAMIRRSVDFRSRMARRG